MFSQLSSLARGVKEPRDYYKGLPLTYPLRPTNTLCFQRSHTRDLYPDRNRIRYHHHRFVLISSIQGRGYVCIDTKKFFIKEGQSILIFPFQFHHYLSVLPDHINWVFITFEMMESDEISSLRYAGARNWGDEGEWLLKHFLKAWPQKKQNCQTLGYYTALLLHNLCQYENTNSSLNPPKNSDYREDILLRVNQYLMPRLNHPMSLGEISKAVRMSKSHLCATFQKYTGNSLGNHVRLLRMQKAAGMLAQTTMTISEISDQYGFDSIYSFSRTFKNVYGLSPRAYRKKLGL